MRILVIPDVHGRDFWIEPCQHIDEFDKVVFLGDYHDPYTFQVSTDTSRHRLRDNLTTLFRLLSNTRIRWYAYSETMTEITLVATWRIDSTATTVRKFTDISPG